MGCCKASIGLWNQKVNELGFDCVSFGKPYDCSSKTRRFLVNMFFFILVPFNCCCKCCIPTEQDLLLSNANWFCKKDEECSSLYFPLAAYEYEEENLEEDDEEEEELFRQTPRRSIFPPRISAGKTFSSSLENERHRKLRNWSQLFDEDDDEDDDDTSTKFILQALAESREALNKLVAKHSSQELIESSEYEPDTIRRANELVQSLKKSQIVYRIFHNPVEGLINIPNGMTYCIKGFFLPSLGSAYEFINFSPLAQYTCYASDLRTLAELHPPNYLNSNNFSKFYKNKIEVLEANELSAEPPANIPCLNISPFKIVPECIAKFVLNEMQEDMRRISSGSLNEDEVVEEHDSSTRKLHMIPEETDVSS